LSDLCCPRQPIGHGVLAVNGTPPGFPGFQRSSAHKFEHNDIQLLALRAGLKLAGKIDHHLFFRDDGTPIRDLNHPYDRCRWTLLMTLKTRFGTDFTMTYAPLGSHSYGHGR
jgi:hypothetical protein